MQSNITIGCPQELLIGLPVSAEKFAEMVKMETAIAFFKKGRISSGLAARWLGMSRVTFLFKAMDAGVTLLADTQDDYQRESSLL